MNRVLCFGVATFFAIVGLALLGGETQVQAGHGCKGCKGSKKCDGAKKCHGRKSCKGGLLARLRARRCNGCKSCKGARRRCCGPPKCCGCSGKAHSHKKKAGDKAPKAPKEKKTSLERTPLAFHQVSFRR